MSRDARLALFLDRAARTPFAWGGFDCCLWLADWVLEARGGPDPAAAFRGAYADELAARELLAANGGLVSLVASQAARAELAATVRPAAGAIGVLEVETLDGRQAAGGICTGPRWAVLTAAGLLVAPMTPLAAWKV